MRKVGRILLEDGERFYGSSFGYEGGIFGLGRMGEVIFNTNMSGYQEVMTDPSYCEQIIVMTYPLIGNYGVRGCDEQAGEIFMKGLVVREYSGGGLLRGEGSLGDYLIRNEIIGIEGVDTRKLAKHIRDYGCMRGFLEVGFRGGLEEEGVILERLRNWGGMLEDLTSRVSTKEGYRLEGMGEGRYHVVVIDMGVKRRILEILRWEGCDLTVMPVWVSLEEVMRVKPDGIFLSNGPGDPGELWGIVELVKGLMGLRKPVFGVCLGHQVLGLALGLRSYKMKAGHRGGNHPVKRGVGGFEMSSHNHGFAIDWSGIPADIEVTHMNLNDGVVEGMRHKELPVFSVQYHPEGSPGPNDGNYLFHEFIKEMERLG